MNNTVTLIPVLNLACVFAPVAAVIFVLWRWTASGGTALYATSRMVLQLVLLGYVLTFVFETDSAAVVGTVLLVMLTVSGWIALRPLGRRDRRHYQRAIVAIAGGGLLTLTIVIGVVLEPDPWLAPRTIIPIAGMIFSNAMNTVSLAAERFAAESAKDATFEQARRLALDAAFIPMINTYFAVGLVALPGMMTGQILSGIEPHVAVRYQIVVMCMTFGAAGLAAIIYLSLEKPRARPSAPTSP